MRAVLQRVSRAECRVGGELTGEIRRGLVVLLGVAPTDTPQTALELAGKVARLRIFPDEGRADEGGRMNRSLTEVGGEVLSVPQFTLFADTRRGNRPSFTSAAPPGQGRALWEAFNAALRAQGPTVAEGRFGADMQVTLTNDGPVTLVLDTEGAAR